MRWGLLLIILVGLLAACGHGGRDSEAPRALLGARADGWLGHGVCYGPHRDGQRPGGPDPTTAQLREDLHLMVPHWNLLRIYSAGAVAETLLAIIRQDELPLQVMLGAWIAPESEAANTQEIEAAIRLAQAYPEIVNAVSVGNETQVFWSGHRSSLPDLIRHVRRVRAAVNVPVTVADDFNFWNKDESRLLTAEVDFLTVHAHPLWGGRQLDESLAWVEAQLDSVRALHPERPVVLGETGWATAVHDQGEQAELIKGRAGEAEQAAFWQEIRGWAAASRQTVYFFEAFDENWKGGDHPNEVEKHWGVFRADRAPKQAITEPTFSR